MRDNEDPEYNFTNYLPIARYPDINTINDFINNRETVNVSTTCWYLFEKYKPATMDNFNLDNYVMAIRYCLYIIHLSELLYRDIKLDNFMIKQHPDGSWNYVLTDIDFEQNKKEYDYALGPRTLWFDDDYDRNEERVIEDFITKICKRGDVRNKLLDNIIGLFTVICITKNNGYYDTSFLNFAQFKDIFKFLRGFDYKVLLGNNFYEEFLRDKLPYIH